MKGEEKKRGGRGLETLESLGPAWCDTHCQGPSMSSFQPPSLDWRVFYYSIYTPDLGLEKVLYGVGLTPSSVVCSVFPDFREVALPLRICIEDSDSSVHSF
jgi:hypothetical protein